LHELDRFDEYFNYNKLDTPALSLIIFKLN